MFMIYGIRSERSNRIYLGQTDDIQRRLCQHNEGYCTSTKNDRPWKLIAAELVQTRSESRWRERQLKQSRGRRMRWLKEHKL